MGAAWDRKSYSGTVEDLLDVPELDGTGELDLDVFAAYLSYSLTDKLTVGYRGEVVVYDGVLDGNGADGTIAWGHTLGLDYKLWANVTSRIEYRIDDSNLAKAADVTTRKLSQSVTLNVIYNF